MVPDQQETMFDEPAELEQAELEIVESEVDQFEPYDEHVIDEQITSEQVTHEQVADEEVAYEAPQPEAQASTPDSAPHSAPASASGSESWHAEEAPAAVQEVSSTPIMTVDDFAALEERVLRAVNLVRREREGRIAAEQRATTLEGELAQQQVANSAVARLQQEVDALRVEREQVRVRVERLLSQLDALEI
jgi:hypothetical protein